MRRAARSLVVLVLLSASIEVWRVRRLSVSGRVTRTPAGDVEWAERGAGPAVLSVHGTPGGYDTALVAGEMLGAHVRWIGVSRLGYLRTPDAANLPAANRLERQSAQFAAALDAALVASAAVLAVSGGGPSAIDFCLRYPARCKALALVSAQTRPALMTGGEQAVQGAGEYLLLATDAFNWAPGVLAPASHLARYVGSLTPILPRFGGLRADDRLSAEFPNLPMEQIACPTLIVAGTRDRFVPFDDARAAAFLIPRAELLPVEGGGHLSPFQQGGAPARRIAKFLERQGRPPA